MDSIELRLRLDASGADTGSDVVESLGSMLRTQSGDQAWGIALREWANSRGMAGLWKGVAWSCAIVFVIGLPMGFGTGAVAGFGGALAVVGLAGFVLALTKRKEERSKALHSASVAVWLLDQRFDS